MKIITHIDRSRADYKAGLIPASLTSSNVIKDNISGATRLIHSPNAIDMSRAKDGLPITWMRHKEGQIVGRAVNFRLDGDVTRADFKITRNEVGQELLNDIEDGIITDVSIGADVIDYEMGDDDVINITRWAPYEVTTGTVVADTSIGINRDKPKEEKVMSDKTETQNGTPDALGSGDVNVLAFDAARKAAAAEAVLNRDKERANEIKEINALFSLPNYQTPVFHDLNRTLIESNSTVEQARKAITEAIGSGVAPVTTDFDQTQDAAIQREARTGFARDTISTGKTDLDKFADAMERTLTARVGIERDAESIREIQQSELFSMNMAELAREFCRRNQVSTAGLNREQVIGQALTRGVIGHSTSDFSNVLENVMNKSLLAGWMETEETWSTWCRQGSLPDFKAGTRTNVSSFSDLDVVYENGEYKYGTFSDLKEPIQLATYGKLHNISRQALANDDLGVFSSDMSKLGRAASRKIGDIAYNILTQASGLGPTLNQDSTALFNAAGHSNYYTGAGAPSVATVNAMITAMATQTDPSGNATLNIRPKYLVVPHALRATAEVLMSSTLNPAEGSTTSFREPNSVMNVAQVVADARLDTASTTAWYMMADQNMHDTVEIAFLNGNSTPYTESRDGWTTDGVELKVRIDAAAAALDYRAIQKHAGA